jgi:hypothetical protein
MTEPTLGGNQASPLAEANEALQVLQRDRIVAVPF